MRKLLYSGAVLAAALAMFGASVAPAQAHPIKVFHPTGKAEAHTNTAHTRIGVKDLECDGRWARVDIKYNDEWHNGYLYDRDCTDDTPLGRPALMTHFRVCVMDLNCSAAREVD